MKKFLLSLATVLCLAVTANAQAIFGYGLSLNEEGTYTAIADGTVIASGTNEAIQTSVDEWGDPQNNFNDKVIFPSGIFAEETTAEAYPIGFDFTYNEKTFTSFAVATNGVIYLGNETVTAYTDGRYTFTSGSGSNLIGFVSNRGNICNDETVISYKTEGTAPNRVLAVEFKELGFLQGYWGTEAYFFDVQLRLYEGTNAIEFVVNNADEAMTSVDDEGNTETYNTLVTIGIKGEGDDVIKVFAGELSEWNAENATSNEFSIDSNIKDGTTFTFAYPQDVVAPTAQATEFVVNNFSTELKGSFKKVEGVDTYLLVYQEGKEITTLPTDKTSYAPEDKIGEATVIEYNESWDYEDVYEFELWDLPTATDYTFAVYAVNSFGLNGPLYNTVDVPTVVTFTNPAAPATFNIVNTTDSTAVINLEANDKANKILVVYNTELVRDNYGDYPLIGELSGEYEAGQKIDTAGYVAYFGEANENIVVTGLEHSKGYFFEAYSYDPTYGYSTDKLSADAATIAHLPYTLDLNAAKTYGLPAGWTKNEDGRFELPSSVPGYTTEDNPHVLWCKETRKDAENGVINQLTSCPIVIDQEDAVVKFDFAMYYQPSRFGTDAYNDWAEGDVFAVQVSTDGETFTDLATYTPENHPEFIYTDTVKSFAQFEGELAQYEGQQIWVRIHWHLFSTSFVPGILVLDNFVVEKPVVASIPEIKVEDVTHVSAKVAWRGEQENYEVAYAKTGEEFTTQVVEAANELELTELESETEYQVKVRGIISEEEYSEWSEVITFTTTAWPACEAPVNLVSEITFSPEEISATLTWELNEEHLSWEVRYRDGNSTEWTTINKLEQPGLILKGLEEGTTYLWNVRANCTADRVTDWSAQASFETPVTPEAPKNLVATVTSSSSITLTWDPVEGAIAYGVSVFGEYVGAVEKPTAGFTKMDPDTEYCFSVFAIMEANAEGYITLYSEDSEEVCATTLPDAVEEIETAFNIYPNPVQSELYIATELQIEEITIYDIYGRQAVRQQVNGSTSQQVVNVADLNSGVYFVKVSTDNGEIVKRFVKK